MHNRLKGLIIILDGLGDRPNPKLGGLTPLEYASTPILDQLAQNGQSGLMDPLLPGLPVDTHTGVGILFGLPPDDAVKLCRGPIEASGIGLVSREGDLLFRSNLATVEKQGAHYRIRDRRAGRISQDVIPLCDALHNIQVGDGITASLYPATQHRCVLRLRGLELSAMVSDTDPGGNNIEKGILGCHAICTTDKDAVRTAQAVNRFIEKSHDILNSHPVNSDRVRAGELPANAVITRGAGVHRDFRNLHAYLDLSAAVVAGESTIIGLGKLLGFLTINDPAFTSLPDTDLDRKLYLAMEAMQTHDLVYIHIKGMDIAAHDRDPKAKADLISRFDSALGRIDTSDLVVGICADHSTDSHYGEHSGDPVPVTIYNPLGRKDRVDRYNETDCISGSLGRITAQGFLISVLDAMGCLSNFRTSEIGLYR